MEVAAEVEECPICSYEFPVRKSGVTAVTWLMIGLMILFALPALGWVVGLFG